MQHLYLEYHAVAHIIVIYHSDSPIPMEDLGKIKISLQKAIGDVLDLHDQGMVRRQCISEQSPNLL